MNNGNNVDNNFPTVDGMVVKDTPAESFNNLYGNNTTQIVNNVNPGMINTQSTTPNINGTNNINQQLINNTVVTPNVAGQSINNGMNAISGQPINNTGVISNMNNVNPGMINNRQMNMNYSQMNNQETAPNFATPNMNSVVNNVSDGFMNNTVVTPNVSAQNINTVNQQMMPNQAVINSGQPMNMNVNLEPIDSDKMQSIEEQLSKTSQYNPEDLQQEKITIPSDNQYEKNKSGLSFVIVLFIILALVIIFLPQITKLIK